MFGNVIAQSFLGGDVRKVKVDGVSVAVLGARLATLACDQMFDKLYLAFGLNFIKLGLLARDREFNRKLAIYRQWGR